MSLIRRIPESDRKNLILSHFLLACLQVNVVVSRIFEVQLYWLIQNQRVRSSHSHSKTKWNCPDVIFLFELFSHSSYLPIAWTSANVSFSFVIVVMTDSGDEMQKIKGSGLSSCNEKRKAWLVFGSRSIIKYPKGSAVASLYASFVSWRQFNCFPRYSLCWMSRSDLNNIMCVVFRSMVLEHLLWWNKICLTYITCRWLFLQILCRWRFLHMNRQG